MTTFAKVNIEDAVTSVITDYKAEALRAELTRTVNAVGSWELLLRDIGGIYKNTFDVQDELDIAVDNIADRLMIGKVDGPAVTLLGRDLESIWDEYVTLRGVDMGQDLLFHNDFEYDYPDPTGAQTLDDVLDDVFNTQLAGLTNIAYIPIVGTPPVGTFEFKGGASFLGQIQELHRRVGWIFYIDDGLLFSPMNAMAPTAAPAPCTFISILGDPTNNILGTVNYQTRDGDKHYNYIKLYGKNPMFDGYTELNAADWTGSGAHPAPIDTTTHIVGSFGQVAANNNPVDTNLHHILTCPIYNYTTWNFNSGEIGFWAKYDNTAGAPGAPGAGTGPNNLRIACRLTDNAGTVVEYMGESSRIYINEWGYCTFPLGEKLHTIALTGDQWCLIIGGPDFDWNNVVKMDNSCTWDGGATFQSHFYIDGLSLPVPVISVQENLGAQAIYRRRPYIDSWSHIRTQHAMDECSQQLLAQSENTLIQRVSFMTPGTKNLRYAGQSINILVPSLGIDDGLSPPGPAIYYITKLCHTIEPYADVSKGYGFDWVTEVEAVPVSAVGYDQGRLGAGSTYSTSQSTGRLGAGVRSR